MADPSPRATPRLWRGGPADPQATRRARSRRRRIFALQGAIMALAGAIVGMLYWIRPIPAPRLVALWVAGYQARPIPPVPMAEPDLAALGRGEFARSAESPLPSQGRPQIDRTLAGLRALRTADPVVIYLRARAGRVAR